MFDLTNKILSIVTDNAANMLKAFWLQGFEDVAVPDAISDDSIDGDDDDDNALPTVVSNNSLWVNVSEHASCFVHTLQLVIKNDFKHAATVSKVLAKTADSSMLQMQQSCSPTSTSCQCHMMDF